MSALRGVIAGGLALTALEALVTSRGAANNAGALFTLTAGAINRLIDPSVPLIPDRR